MDNKVFGTTFLAIIFSALLFFGVANAGSFAVDQWLFPMEEFGDNTYIGDKNISNMEITEVRVMFTGQVESWRETADLQVTYQDLIASYPLENAQILLDETVKRAETGKQNNFVFELSEETTKTFLAEHFPVVEFADSDIEKITEKLEVALEDGKTQTRVSISDDTIDLNHEIVSSASFPHNLQNPGAQDIISALNSYQIAPNATFSFLDFLNELNFHEISDQELSEIASAIYGTVLQTNFIIDERSIGTFVPATIPLGQEATVNRNLGVDLVFSNPNDSSFILSLATAGNMLNASLSGYPFNYQYMIQTGSQETVEPRLIKQFSSFVSSGFSVKEPGSEGIRIEVLRSIMVDGEELEIEPVSTDFYAPVHRVEVYPLSATIVETTPEDGTGDTDGEETGSTGSFGDKDTQEDSTNPSDSDNEDGSNANKDGEDSGDNKNNNDSVIDSDGTMKSKDPVYDKGGNKINP